MGGNENKHVIVGVTKVLDLQVECREWKVHRPSNTMLLVDESDNPKPNPSINWLDQSKQLSRGLAHCTGSIRGSDGTDMLPMVGAKNTVLKNEENEELVVEGRNGSN